MSNILSIHCILWHFNLGNGYDLSYIEAIGTMFGLLCIWFASIAKRYNFYFGVINVIFFAMIFFQIHLYANLLLQMFFLIMNLYGLYNWGRYDKHMPEIHWLSWSQRIYTVVGACVAVVLLTYNINQLFAFLMIIMYKAIISTIYPYLVSPTFTNDPHPLIDSIITVFSIIAMVQATQKIIDNWLFWIVINILSIILYYQQGVYFIALEHIIVLGIAINGSIIWAKQAHNEST